MTDKGRPLDVVGKLGSSGYLTADLRDAPIEHSPIPERFTLEYWRDSGPSRYYHEKWNRERPWYKFLRDYLRWLWRFR